MPSEVGFMVLVHSPDGGFRIGQFRISPLFNYEIDSSATCFLLTS